MDSRADSRVWCELDMRAPRGTDVDEKQTAQKRELLGEEPGRFNETSRQRGPTGEPFVPTRHCNESAARHVPRVDMLLVICYAKELSLYRGTDKRAWRYYNECNQS